jgi:ADP-ribose pyrophosphatase YjhB (NUDIX family)
MEAVSEKIVEQRWGKKKESLKALSQNLAKLRRKVNSDLKCEDEKDFLTALVVAVMLRTSERVGNEESAKESGHYGVTGFEKSHIKQDDNDIHFSYKGKSGVDHEKKVTDKYLSKYLSKAIKDSPSKRVFTTSDGFDIKPDRVNRYLKDFEITSKDIRGHSANSLVCKRLNRLDIGEEEKDRKKQWNGIVREVAEYVGHGKATLQKHYLLPELKPQFLEKGNIISVAECDKFEEGGEIIHTVEPKSVGVAFIWNEHILLVHHPNSRKFEKTLSIPKGRQEENEIGAEVLTAIREVKEEIGIHVPFNWLMDKKLHSVFNSQGREIQYYIVNINHIKVVDMTSLIVSPHQYQREEVDWAGFLPFDKAWDAMIGYQKPILVTAGFEPPVQPDSYIKFRKGNEEGVLSVETGSPNHTNMVDGLTDLGFDFQLISKEEFEAYEEGDEMTIEEFKERVKKNKGGEADVEPSTTQYQFRDIGGIPSYYKRENGSDWKFINKDEFFNNATSANTIFPKDIKDGAKIELEHKDTLEELKSKDLTVEEGAKKIAEDHLEERADYYDVVAQQDLEEGGIIEGQLHSECDNDDGCGEKFEVGDGGRIIEAERDEAVIVAEAFKLEHCPVSGCIYEIKGTCSQIASALNVIGGGKNFDEGAEVLKGDIEAKKEVQDKPEANDTDVDRAIEGGSIIINRRSMADPKIYIVTGTPRQIASQINSNNGNGVEIEDGGSIREA